MPNLNYNAARDIVRNRGSPVNSPQGVDYDRAFDIFRGGGGGYRAGQQGGAVPTTIHDIWNAMNQERDRGLAFQEGQTQQINAYGSPFDYPGVQETLNQLNIGSPFYNRQLRGIGNQAATAQRSAESRIGGILGARGIGGSPEASLMGQAVNQNLQARLAGQGELDRNIMGARTGLLGDLSRIQGALDTTRIGAVSGQEYPMLDPSIPFSLQEAMDIFEQGQQDLTDTRESTAPFGEGSWLYNLFNNPMISTLLSFSNIFGVR